MVFYSVNQWFAEFFHTCMSNTAISGGTPMRIEQAQYEYDDDGNPVTRLSLRRMDDRFEIAAPEVNP